MRRIVFYLLPLASVFSHEEQPLEPPAPPPLDYQALEEWIQSKHIVMGKGLAGNLFIGGEVRVEMQQKSEVLNNVKQRGGGGAFPNSPTANYDVELNLLLNYRSEVTWAAIKLEFDNNMGVFNGTTNRIALERAFFGVRFFDYGGAIGAVEFGRRKLSFTFDSLVEFSSYMDGVLLKFNAGLGDAADFYLNAGPFLVNERKSQYAYVGEVGFLNIYNTGIYVKYSLIDWDTKNFSDETERSKFRFINSQWILGYKFVPPYFEKVVTLFGAVLVNHAAKRLVITDDQKSNIAWYTGFYIGEARQQGDWSLSVVYEYVQAQSVPQFDNNGIGTGNTAGANFYDATTPETAHGNTNYKGITIDLLYLFTDQITLQNSYSQSIRAQTNIGPPFRNKQYELELIYAF